MTDHSTEIVNDHLTRMAENLPLLERFTLSKGQLISLTISELHTIALIGRLASPRMSELAQRGRVTRGTITFMIDKLEKKGYVKKTRNEKDRRVVRVSLTPLGTKANKLHEEFHRRIIDSIMGLLTESERQQAAVLVEKIVMALEQQ
ncbi:MarR family transcriptional regulator [Candidatus Poribacteria bacterium]|nr:MarR family transcriptional regulator [Candidatus Poribacteria bacterium]